MDKIVELLWSLFTNSCGHFLSAMSLSNKSIPSIFQKNSQKITKKNSPKNSPKIPQKCQNITKKFKNNQIITKILKIHIQFFTLVLEAGNPFGLVLIVTIRVILLTKSKQVGYFLKCCELLEIC